MPRTSKAAVHLSLVGLSLLMMIVGTVFGVQLITPASATGSITLTPPPPAPPVWRPFIEWHNTALSGGVPRRTTIKAFARAGEEIYLGSSAMRYGQGDVVIYDPLGITPANLNTCAKRGGANPLYGRIENRAQEVKGPSLIAGDGGFVPCVITADETTAAGDGIWEFDFISPNPTATIGNNPAPIQANEEWNDPVNRAADRQNFWINAWDVSVRGDNVEQKGRVFANYLAFNLGNNATSTKTDLGIDAEFHVLTYDGYSYRVDTNGMDPFGFIFFATSRGIIDTRGIPIYRSLQLKVPNETQLANVLFPPGYSIHRPTDLDNFSTNAVTHKIFFEKPDESMPLDAPQPQRTAGASASTWLLRDVVPAPIAENFRFVGVEGTENQAGTNPLGGYFSFDAPPGIGYALRLDTNRSNVFGDESPAGSGFIDRVLLGTTATGRTTVYWDGLDASGKKVVAGTTPFKVQVQLFAGEVHFPFIDAENNPKGLILERQRDLNTIDDPDRYTIYWNDSYTYSATSAYDYSLCASGEQPPPPGAALGIGTDPGDLVCYGVPIDARSALNGTDSQNGAHKWRFAGTNAGRGLGDRRLIDTWTYVPSNDPGLINTVLLAEADLQITKSSSPNPLKPGGPINYVIKVKNVGPSNAVGAAVNDNIPATVIGATWQCAISAGSGACAEASGSGNVIDTTVNLNVGAEATYTIQGTLSPSARDAIENVATVRRPNDVTDPNNNNNIARNITPIITVADLELTKAIATPPPIAANTVVEFTIDLRNRGPSAATNVEVLEQLPAGLTYVSHTAGKGTYTAGTGVWNVGPMAVDEVTTLTLRATWNGTPLTNTAQVSKSDQPDPDSTPANNQPSEDDQSSVNLPIAVADLRLTKTVNTPRVNVGSNARFTITLTNDGPAGATNVHVKDQLPIGLAFVGATPSQGSYNPASGDWLVGNLATGASATLQIDVTLLNPGPFVNTAQVSDVNQYDPDSTPNNDNPAEDDQGFATVAGDLVDLELSKQVSNAVPAVNGQITYTVKVDNRGPSAATGVAVLDKLPAGLTFVSATPSQGAYVATSGVWTVGGLANGASATLNIVATVTTISPVVNTAQVSAADQPDIDSTPANSIPTEDDQASVTLTPQVADLRLVKTVDTPTPAYGGEVVYTIDLTNDGPSQATNVQVRDELPAGLIYVSHTAAQGSYNHVTGIWQVGSLASGAASKLTIRARLSDAGPYTNTAQVSKSDQFDPDSTPGNNRASEDDQSSVTVAAPVADLSVTKLANVSVVPAGGAVVYTIEVLNSGPNPATNVSVAEQLPAGATVQTTTPTQGTYAAGTWTVGTLAVGQRATLTLNVQLTGAGPFTNTAQVSTSDQYDPDSTPGNNNPREDDQDSALIGPAPAPQPADLELTKVAEALPKLADGVLFTIEVINKGPAVATNVAASDRLPAGLDYVSHSVSQGSYTPLSGVWEIGTLPVNGKARLVISARLTSTQDVINIAEVTKSDQPDPDSTPNNGGACRDSGGEDDRACARVNRLTPVELLGFSAQRSKDGILVRWETGAELQTLGFQLYRSSGDTRAGAERVTPTLIVARGGPSTGASYSFLDRGALPGVRYTYWLAEVTRQGPAQEYGPVRSGPELGGDSFTIYLPLTLR